jgi:hypothetical protein
MENLKSRMSPAATLAAVALMVGGPFVLPGRRRVVEDPPAELRPVEPPKPPRERTSEQRQAKAERRRERSAAKRRRGW